MSERPRLLIDIVADFVCPWCFVGLAAFLHARKMLLSEFQAIPRFRAYQLNPGTPAEGLDRQAYYQHKFPDETRRAQIRAQLIEAGAAAGLEFDPSRPTRLPNTLGAHQILRQAHFTGLQERAALNLYLAYWQDDADLGDIATLARLAGEAGMDADMVRARLEAGEDEKAVRAEAEAFRAAGVEGVPTFIVNERTGFAGALAPDRLAAALRKAARE